MRNTLTLFDCMHCLFIRNFQRQKERYSIFANGRSQKNIVTNKFKKDLKRIRKQGKDLDLLQDVLQTPWESIACRRRGTITDGRAR